MIVTRFIFCLLILFTAVSALEKQRAFSTQSNLEDGLRERPDENNREGFDEFIRREKSQIDKKPYGMPHQEDAAKFKQERYDAMRSVRAFQKGLEKTAKAFEKVVTLMTDDLGSDYQNELEDTANPIHQFTKKKDE